tara:strand:+ start:3889 stop:4965 length:1077 start_codon:yes stop_codon:yes gene_type:complete
MKKQIISRAPLRLGLAGGGTDLRLFSKNYGGNVVNLTIKKYVYCKVIPITKNYTIFDSQDQNKINKYFFNEKKNKNKNYFNQNFLLGNIYKYIRDKYNENKNFSVKIVTYSEVPSGSGLGSSSTLVVTVISALLKYLNKKITKKKLAEESIYLERDLCKIPGGYQDQYAAVYGGLNFISFKKKGSVIVNKIKYKTDFIRLLESSIILFFYNKKRISSKVIKNQNKNIYEKDIKTLKALVKLKKEAINLKKSIEQDNYRGFIKTLKRGWVEKQKTSNFITDTNIIKILKKLIKIGADSVKVSGAGGGGFFFILSKLENRSDIINFLKKQNGILTETCNITLDGVETWIINEKKNNYRSQ